MKTDAPSWWSDIVQYFVYDDMYRRSLSEDCPKELREKFEDYEKEAEKE